MTKRIQMIAIVAALVSGMTIQASDSMPAPRRVEISAKRFAFDPDQVTLTRGEPVVLVVKSLDVAHGMRFRDLGLDLRVPKGGIAELKFTPEKAGDFVGHCSVFCGAAHAHMMITLHVVD